MTKEELLLLEELGIYDLRIKLREVGGTPGHKSKNAMIAEIKSIIESGKKPVRSTRGRKASKHLSDFNGQLNILDKDNSGIFSKPILEDAVLEGNYASGIFEFNEDGSGFLFEMNGEDVTKPIVIVPAKIVEGMLLRRGDFIEGKVEVQNGVTAITSVLSVNGVFTNTKRREFERLTPTYPNEKFKLERVNGKDEPILRFIDLFCPIGKGQRGLIVSHQKNGAQDLLEKIATSINENNPNVYIITLFLGIRPEEVTEVGKIFKGEVVCTTFDQSPNYNVSVIELVLSRAKRLTELGKDVVLLTNSINSLVRAYNQTASLSGKCTVEAESCALQGAKKFFGSARNIEEGGSLTVIATINTEPDTVIYEEFKEACNMELHLKETEPQNLSDVDLIRSSTIKAVKLLTAEEYSCVSAIIKTLGKIEEQGAFIEEFKTAKSNDEFVAKYLSENI